MVITGRKLRRPEIVYEYELCEMCTQMIFIFKVMTFESDA